MIVEVERFDISAVPDSGRPRVVEFRIPKKGRLSLHAERETGALWMFVSGPAGGDRGRLVFTVKHAQKVASFLDAGNAGRLWSNDYTLTTTQPGRHVRGEDGFAFVPEETDDRIVSVRRGSSMQPWSARFDAAALAEFRAALREWSATALAATADPPKPGEHFLRGDAPGGTAEQILAWKRAGPEGQLVRITAAPAEGSVRYAHVSRHGNLGGELRVPLVTFYGDGWRPIGDTG